MAILTSPVPPESPVVWIASIATLASCSWVVGSCAVPRAAVAMRLYASSVFVKALVILKYASLAAVLSCWLSGSEVSAWPSVEFASRPGGARLLSAIAFSAGGQGFFVASAGPREGPGAGARRTGGLG